MENLLIPFSITMLILALVTERVANFCKLYLQDKTIYIFYPHRFQKHTYFFLKARIRILAYKQPTKQAEKQREYRIMTINILIGIIVAVLMNANLFQIIQDIFEQSNSSDGVRLLLTWDIKNISGWQFVGLIYFIIIMWWSSLIFFNHLYESENSYKPTKGLIWFSVFVLLVPVVFLIINQKEGINIVTHIVGYIGTGLFLSLGSKFWHDTLDLILRIKDTRQKLGEKETFSKYSSADEIINLAQTPRIEVVEKLFEKYRNEITGIYGVVSTGINDIIDPSTKLYKKQIEIEFSSSDAQQKLNKIISTGSVEIAYNTYYLSDYTSILYTEPIMVVNGLDNADTSDAISQTNDNFNNNPVCYAFNTCEKDSIGSFSVIKKGNKYFAISNLHVFATSADLHRINNGETEIQHKNVCFYMGTRAYYGTIDDFKFGDFMGDGIDYCLCSVEKEVYDEYFKIVDSSKLVPNDFNHMAMFGAISKYDVSFYQKWNGTYCNINYKGFQKTLFLYKILPTNTNVERGDSGSVIYYNLGTSKEIYKGMLVAKSDNYSYMSKLI